MKNDERAQPSCRSGALTREEARGRAALISDVTYAVTLDLTGGDETFGCEATIRFRSARPGASTFIDLAAPTVLAAELNGRLLPPGAHDGVGLVLPRLASENTLRIAARCAYSRSGIGMHIFRDPVDGRVYCYTDFEPREAHRVFPCFDQPDLKGTFQFSVIARPGWQVMSNASPAARPEGGAGGRWEFAPTPLLPTYVTAIVAGPYHAVRDRHRGAGGEIDLAVHCRQSLARYLDPDEIFEVTRQGFAFFEELFDYPYPFGRKYDQIFVPEYNSGAMENAGCVTHNESMIFRSKVTDAAREHRAQSVLHELAHMWFGDLVTMRWWDDLWLNESFATYMGQLSQVRATRFTNGWTTFAKSEKPWAYAQDQLPTTHPIVADVPDSEAARTNFDGISYAKGAAVLKQLVAWVGEQAFIAGVRKYFRAYAYRNADLAAFLGALEEASGRDLRAWSREWLETAGVNTLRAAFRTSADGSRFTAFALEQAAPPEWPTLRSHRVAVGLYDLGRGGLVRRRRVELDAVGLSTAAPELAGEQAPDLVLVNDDDLTYAKVRLDLRSIATITRHLAALTEPLARTLCWTAAWDEMRDAELPARRYLELVLRNIHTEDDVGVVQSLLAHAAAAVTVYGDPGNREAARLALASAAEAGLEGAAPGGDLQLAWARAFIGAARTEEHVELLCGLLDGSRAIGGLAVDTDLRWRIVQALAALGAAGEELIEAELQRDPTDAGERHAATARAARPTAEAKAAAWEVIAGNHGRSALPLATVKAAMAGFHRYDQAELLRPYAEKYFAALEPIWKKRDIEESLAFASTMYPGVLASEELVGMTDDYLVMRDPAPPIRRCLVEGRDHVRRALRARAVDAAAAAAPEAVDAQQIGGRGP